MNFAAAADAAKKQAETWASAADTLAAAVEADTTLKTLKETKTALEKEAAELKTGIDKFRKAHVDAEKSATEAVERTRQQGKELQQEVAKAKSAHDAELEKLKVAFDQAKTAHAKRLQALVDEEADAVKKRDKTLRDLEKLKAQLA